MGDNMTEFYIGKTFTIDEYELAFVWLQEQNNPYYCIEEIEAVDEVRQFKLVDKTPSAEEQEREEKERIARLNLTGADVERGIYKAKGMDFDDIVNMVSTIQPEGLDIKALKIELKANNFYRGNPYVDAVGALLGFTSEQLDKFFETNDYTNLLA